MRSIICLITIDVYNNIAFGLKLRKFPKKEIPDFRTFPLIPNQNSNKTKGFNLKGQCSALFYLKALHYHIIMLYSYYVYKSKNFTQ